MTEKAAEAKKKVCRGSRSNNHFEITLAGISKMCEQTVYQQRNRFRKYTELEKLERERICKGGII